MKIDELEANTKVTNLVATIIHLGETHETPTGVNVQDGIIEDSTGQCNITFWGDQADQFEQGDKIILSAGWAKTFEDNIQVSSGKFGKIKKLPQ